MTVNFAIFREHLTIYNKAIKRSREEYYAKLIIDNKNCPKFLFSTIDQLINPVVKSNNMSNEKCDEFAAYFSSKVTNIRLNVIN